MGNIGNMDILTLDDIKKVVEKKVGHPVKWVDSVDSSGNLDFKALVPSDSEVETITYIEDIGFKTAPSEKQPIHTILHGFEIIDGGVIVMGALNGILVIDGKTVTQADLVSAGIKVGFPD